MHFQRNIKEILRGGLEDAAVPNLWGLAGEKYRYVPLLL